MTRLWKVVAIATLGVAAYQWLKAFEHIVGGIAFAVATGRHRLMMVDEPGRLTYLIWLVGVSAVAALSSRHLRKRSPDFARCGRSATYLVLGNAVFWTGLLASPFVDHLIPFAPAAHHVWF